MLEKLFAISLIGIILASVNLVISTENPAEFDLVAFQNPEPLIEHPERANETQPMGAIGYIDTTNPYKNWTNGDPLNELYIQESYNGYRAFRRLDLILAIDEEATSKWGLDYSIRAIERADEAFVALHYIDFRIRSIVFWESDDTLEWFDEIYWEVYKQTKHYLGSYVNGSRIDAIIAISGQETKDDVAGLSPSFPIMGNNTLALVRFQIYWADDNLIQHEVSHFYGPDDHPKDVEIDCVMARYSDYIMFLSEDGNWYDMFTNVARGFRIYTWCSADDHYLVSSGGSGGGWRQDFLRGGAYPQ